MAKRTEGGDWLAAQRRTLGLTPGDLGAALGLAANTIRAIECGVRGLSESVRLRAEAFFSKELLREPAGDDQIPPPGLVRVSAWVTPATLTAALAVAKRSGAEVEAVLGEWAGKGARS